MVEPFDFHSASAPPLYCNITALVYETAKIRMASLEGPGGGAYDRGAMEVRRGMLKSPAGRLFCPCRGGE